MESVCFCSNDRGSDAYCFMIKPRDAKRLFVAVSLPRLFLDVFDRYRQENKKISGIRWVKKDNFHITVCFIGYVDGQNLSVIINNLGKVANQVRPFKISFERVCFAPPFRNPTMVWALFSSSVEFQDLVDRVNNSLAGFLKTTDKKFIPHVTLARFKNSREAVRRLKIRQPVELVGRQVLISSILLMESKLSKEGAEYIVLEKFDFNV